MLSGSAFDVSSSANGSTSAGRVVIRAGRFVMENSDVLAVERSAGGVPGSIDVGVNGAVQISEGSLLLAATESLAIGPDIRLAAPLVAIEGGRIASEARGGGEGGAVEIDARILRVSNASQHFEGSFVASGTEPGAIFLGGVRFAGERMSAGGEIRYQHANADLAVDFTGPRLDLGGWTYNVTVGLRF